MKPSVVAKQKCRLCCGGGMICDQALLLLIMGYEPEGGNDASEKRIGDKW